ncbi:class I SAM-dependent methyltransferase [Anaerovorax odorimutans]|uniref:class I SAM-dependent methyltransferase n=1 Tax=Anaerovorax odorimutans TaxID=109327 RepID=UPI001A992861|nr:class I SAM-dependent methyltransferase [Anaerovorax odorimutans]
MNANKKTQYFSKLSIPILEYIEKSDRICEIACGLGFLSMELAKKAKEVLSIDISPEAIDFMNTYLEKNSIKNINTSCGDWRKLCKEKVFDVVILSYFGAILNDWSLLKSIASKYIIAILPQTYRKDKVSNEDLATYNRETVDNVTEFLTEKKIPFKLMKDEIEFGQPFDKIEDAFNFISHYYNISDRNYAKEYLNKNLIKKEGYYYLPKTRKFGIFIIGPFK